MIQTTTDGFAELTLETHDPGGLEAQGIAVRGPEEHDGGDRSIYVEDPAGNVAEVWDFFARRPIDALSG